MGYKLPPLNGIRAVEAVGRHGSISGAADELCVTPGAVSRQVAIIEEYFGRRLFIRDRSGMLLTEVGGQYVEHLTTAFKQLDSASARPMRSRESTILKIRMLGVIASEWLLERIAEFEARHPTLEIQIVADKKLVNFDTDIADVGIIAGHGDWSGLESELLYSPYFTLLASTKYMGERAIEAPNDLSQHRALHPMDMRPNWDEWMSAVFPGVYVDLPRSCWFENSSQMYRTIRRGGGIGLGNCLMAEDGLLDGTLVTPVKAMVPAPASVYLAWPKRENHLTPFVHDFRDWICGEMEKTQKRVQPIFDQMEKVSLNLSLSDLFDN